MTDAKTDPKLAEKAKKLGVGLLTPEQADAQARRKIESGEWYVLQTRNGNPRHLAVFVEIEETHYAGTANKDFELIVDFRGWCVTAFMRKSRMSLEDFATHVGLPVAQLAGKDIFLLTDDHAFAVEANKTIAEIKA